MGINNSNDKDKFFMHIKFIGSNIGKIFEIFNKSETLKEIKKYWKIDPIVSKNNLEQINIYFDSIKEKDENKNVRECLFLKINNILSPEFNALLERMNDLSETYLMPLVLLLTTNEISQEKFEKEKKNIIENYEEIDPRLIFLQNYTEDEQTFEDKIAPIILRFCSIHNELGDKFNLGDKNIDQDFSLINKEFPFNLNIACIGRFGQGKSTCVNELLQEYKAKESTKGCAQTKDITYYHVDNKPIRILDIPGFESERTVNNILKHLQFCGKLENRLKDNIHIILYIFNYYDERAFPECEYPIIEEIVKHKSSKIIYVITHSVNNLNTKKKKKVYDKINTGLSGITKNKPIQNKIDMMKADENNVVFVNFHKLNNIEPFGKKELCKKIHDFFLGSETYKEFLKTIRDNNIEEEVKRLRAQAEQILLPNKIYGAIAGIIPFADMVIQKFIINKNSVKKAGEIFGIKVEFIDEEIEKEEKNKEKNNNITQPEYLNNYIEEENLEKIKAEELLKEKNSHKIQKLVENGSQTVSLIKGGAQTIKYCSYMNKVSEICKEMDKLEKLYAIPQKIYTGCLQIPYFESELIDEKYYNLLDSSINIENIANQTCIFKFFGIGTIIGIASGAYFTHKYCESILDKYVEYYKKNVTKIENSYKEAISYLEKIYNDTFNNIDNYNDNNNDNDNNIDNNNDNDNDNNNDNVYDNDNKKDFENDNNDNNNDNNNVININDIIDINYNISYNGNNIINKENIIKKIIEDDDFLLNFYKNINNEIDLESNKFSFENFKKKIQIELNNNQEFKNIENEDEIKNKLYENILSIIFK